MPQDQHQPVKEGADRLKGAKATVRPWIKGGDLHAIDIGKGWRSADTDLQEFLSAHQTAPEKLGLGLKGQSAMGQA
ncbi:DNA-binding protein [Cereibacter changlensis JA139]|uniref:DNA-binding protein n=1 Tax=Cereibacter changlensis JA139 TaxID=1188249 RepID=A0A2T4JZ96_9RHOB|nr:helix-turn-helix domain-containing protein [Cereibacter changlensis]PTE23186.1 DNA-binding protein [Cereibacter changlensis JA139]